MMEQSIDPEDDNYRPRRFSPDEQKRRDEQYEQSLAKNREESEAVSNRYARMKALYNAKVKEQLRNGTYGKTPRPPSPDRLNPADFIKRHGLSPLTEAEVSSAHEFYGQDARDILGIATGKPPKSASNLPVGMSEGGYDDASRKAENLSDIAHGNDYQHPPTTALHPWDRTSKTTPGMHDYDRSGHIAAIQAQKVARDLAPDQETPITMTERLQDIVKSCLTSVPLPSIASNPARRPWRTTPSCSVIVRQWQFPQVPTQSGE